MMRILLIIILVDVSFSALGETSHVLCIKETGSVNNLQPWLYLRTNNHRVKLTEVIDTLVVQSAYEFEFFLCNPLPERVTFYFLPGDNSIFADWVAVGKTMHHLPKKPVQVIVEAGQVLGIRFQLPELDRMTPERLSPQLLTPFDLEQYEQGGKFVQPFFIGIYLFMVLFNLFFYIISGWQVYLKYAIYIFLCTAFFSYYFGSLQIIFPGVVKVSNNLVWILSSVIATSYVIFISDFGEFKRLNRKAHLIFQAALYFKFFQIPTETILWTAGFNFIQTQEYLHIILVFEGSIVLFGLYYLLVSPSVRAKIIVVASFILLVASMLGQLNIFPQINRVTIIEIGTLIEIMIFSVSLALKTKEIDRNRIMVVEQLLEKTKENIKIQERVSAELEQQVHERTITLERRNKENEMLLAEIHHRVKNNLQIISSLINLKARSSSTETTEALQQLNGRIFSMGLIHEKLYAKENFRLIRLDSYLVELSQYILSSLHDENGRVELKMDCEAVHIDVESALTCGLINNELLTNSLKYAFPIDQDNREIKLSLKKTTEAIELIIADNGAKASSIPEKTDNSFGLRFVEQLVKSKLGGDWKIKTDNGFQVLIKFPALDYSYE